MKPIDPPVLRDQLEYQTIRIFSHHDVLNELYADLLREIQGRSLRDTIVCFGRMRDSLEAHFEVEEKVYFPAVERLLPDREPFLRALSSEHAEFRVALEKIEPFFQANELARAEQLLGCLVGRLNSHERREDSLMKEITEATGGTRATSIL